MGEARARRALGLPPRGLKASTPPKMQAYVTLAKIDRRIERREGGETRFEDHSQQPGVYADVKLKTFYRWDGIALRRLDSNPFAVQTTDHSA